MRRTRARLPAWLRPGGQQAYRFHRLSTEEGLQQGGSRGADDAGEEEEGAGGGAPREGSAGEHRPAGRWCPEEQAGFLSRLTFSYVGGLIRLGYRSARAAAPAVPCFLTNRTQRHGRMPRKRQFLRKRQIFCTQRPAVLSVPVC